MWIKICANTNLEDAQLAASLGADAVGFVFAPSRRIVNVEQVAAITPYLPPHIERVGVFPLLPAHDLVSAARQAGLTTLQLHHAYAPALLSELHRLLPDIRIIQSVHWNLDNTQAQAAVADQLRSIASDGLTDRILIDSQAGLATGGTGIPFDWSAARSLFTQAAAAGQKLILAGGLRHENVAQAIHELQPWGVDVASGVEAEPGRKSYERLCSFIKNARAV